MGEVNTNLARDVAQICDQGVYDHALRCYFAARQWVMETGQCFRQDIYGIIQHPHHPDHAESPGGKSSLPEHLIDDPGWKVVVNIWAGSDEALEWIRSLPVPESAQLK